MRKQINLSQLKESKRKPPIKQQKKKKISKFTRKERKELAVRMLRESGKEQKNTAKILTRN